MTNVFSVDERRKLAGLARTLYERLSGPANSPDEAPPIEPDAIIDEWIGHFPDEQAFHARLERDGLTEQLVREQIEATYWPEQEPLPSWIDTIEDLTRYVESWNAPNDEIVPEERAFSELLAAVVAYARAQLPDETVPVQTRAPLRDWLADRLESVCLRPMYVEFKSFIEFHDPELAAAGPDDVSEPSTTYYDRFIDSMFDFGFKNLCLEYPVLARYLVRIIEQWTDMVIEVSDRIQADRSTLEARFGVSGDVTMLTPLAEDTHAGGRVPIRVSFESGAVIHKPRSVGGGVVLYTIFDRLGDHLELPSFRIPEYVSRDRYGWMEVIEYSDLPDVSSTEAYYERAGVLLCLAYTLNFIDGQLENVIAAGTDPMIVDGETVFHPHIDPTVRPAQTETAHLVDRSLLSTALLPWSSNESQKSDETSWSEAIAGLGSESGRSRITFLSRPNVKAVNTDVMTVEDEEVQVGSATNTPTVDGRDQPPRDNVDALIRGFDEAYSTIVAMHSADRFFSEVAPREVVAGVENRLVYRSTMIYDSILRSAVGRNPLRDGIRTSVVFDRLSVPFFDDRIESESHWSLYGAERRALRRRDIPRITSRIDGRSLFHDGEPLAFTATTSGYDRCRKRLAAMDSVDRNRQTWLIREIFDDGTARNESPSENGTGFESKNDTSDECFDRVAVELFDDVVDARVATGDDNGWAVIASTRSNLNLFPADYSLYWGRGGIALVAAALYTTTGHDRYRRFVEETLAPIIDDCRSGELAVGLGGTRGIGSIVYTLSVISELVGEETYRRSALDAARMVSSDRIAADDTYDIMTGAAGTVLGLLAYHDRYGESCVLDRAIACGDRLLEARISRGGYRIWNTNEDDLHLTGLSHGSSGIAYALGRLAATTGVARYAEAAQEAFEFESTVYSETRNNWARSFEEDIYLDRWCHGRSGMALARIAVGNLLGDETLLDTADAAIGGSSTMEMSPVDSVCCGNFGRVETRLVAARRANGDRTDATRLARQCLACRRNGAELSLSGHSRWFVNPTFFDGVSGVAYTLLRLHDPDSLPSVLLLE